VAAAALAAGDPRRVAQRGQTALATGRQQVDRIVEQVMQAHPGRLGLGLVMIINQYLAAGLLDELELHIVPLLLGGGARLFDNLGGAEIKLEQVRAVEAPGVAHVKYRVVRG
jgi:dihydrofolate reductase